jgi:hypothetical protein
MVKRGMFTAYLGFVVLTALYFILLGLLHR